MVNVLIEEIYTNLDGFDIYSLFKAEKDVVLLDSGRDEKNLGRYSFIGLNSFMTFKYKNGICTKESICTTNSRISKSDIYTIYDSPDNINSYKGDLFLELNKVLQHFSIVNNTTLPFIGGGIGYFSYDLCRELEYIPSQSIEDVDIPYCYYNFYDNIIIVDNLEKRTYISALGIIKEPLQSIEDIKNKIVIGNKVSYADIIALHDKFLNDSYSKCSNSNTTLKFNSNFTEKNYINTVSKVKDYIKSGDVYITNLTQRFYSNTYKESYDIYKHLRYINPAPFAALMTLDGFDIICSSPERFLRIKNKQVETRPIKGTRPRGSTMDEDLKYKNELLNSEKDKAELLMIVDLERNDLSKVCKPNTVKVTELFSLEEYSTVFHLVATVIGQLKDECTPIDCIKACFPGGSITGAPKIRSMEVIDELEGVRRNIYTGAIGYLGFDGNVDLNIVIRTILLKNNTAYFGVGGGITYDSDEKAEYDETLDKAKALMRALGTFKLGEK